MREQGETVFIYEIVEYGCRPVRNAAEYSLIRFPVGHGRKYTYRIIIQSYMNSIITLMVEREPLGGKRIDATMIKGKSVQT